MPLDPLSIMTLVYRASVAPDRHLEAVWEALAAAQLEGDLTTRQRIAPVLIDVLLEHGRDLEKGEQLARAIVTSNGTRANIGRLVAVLEARGCAKEAEIWREKAKTSPDPFYDDPVAVAKADQDLRDILKIVDAWENQSPANRELGEDSVEEFQAWWSKKLDTRS